MVAEKVKRHLAKPHKRIPMPLWVAYLVLYCILFLPLWGIYLIFAYGVLFLLQCIAWAQRKLEL